MFKHLLSVAAIAAISFGSALAQDAEAVKFADVADTWLRSSSPNETNRGTADKLEVRKEAIKDGDEITGYHNYVGLLGFEFNVPAGMKVSKATLHFVTERFKGSKLSIRPYAADFDEKSSWSSQEENILAALELDPIFTGDLAGQWNKAVFDNNLAEDKRNLAAWTNEVDVTAYAKTVTGSRINFILSQDDVDNKAVTQQNCIYSKEAKDLTNNNYPEFTATAAELVPYLEVEFAVDANNETVVLGTVADTQLRSDKDGNFGGNGNMEIKSTAAGVNFYGLLEFALPAEIFQTESYELNSVSLRLVCVQNKGSRPMSLYAYGNTVDEATKFSAEQTFIDAALATDPVAEFEAKGQGTKAMGDGGLNDAYKTAEAWTSYIDLSDYVKGLVAGETRAAANGHIAFMLAKSGQHNDAMRFGTKEAGDIVSKTEGVEFKAADLVPQLTVSYSKKTDGIADVAVSEDATDAAAEYYTLSGVRVAAEGLAPGIYVKRQGAKAVKVYVK